MTEVDGAHILIVTSLLIETPSAPVRNSENIRTVLKIAKMFVFVVVFYTPGNRYNHYVVCTCAEV